MMPFTATQQALPLAEKGVGKTVLWHLAQMGLNDRQALSAIAAAIARVQRQ